MRKITLFILALIIGVGGVKAKDVYTTTTLWEGTDDGSDIYVDKAKLVAGATITLTFNWLTGDGAQFSCFYWDGSAWQNIYNWKWVDNGKTFSFSLTQDQIDAIPSQLGFKTNVIDKMTLAKIAQTVTNTETETGTTTIWSGSHDLDSWSGLQLTGSSYREILQNAKKGDVLKITYTSDEAGQINVCFNDYSTIKDGHFSVSSIAEPTVIEFEIVTATILESIQNKGIVLNGTNALLTTVELLTYASSYDCVPATIGSDGIATFSSSKKLDFTATGVTPYYISAVTTGSVTLTAATNATTWGWCGYILQGPEGTYDVPVTESATYPAATYLKGQVGSGTVAASTGGKYHYIFAKDEGGNIGFYKLTADHTLGAHKAYLETDFDITPAAGTKAVSLVFLDETTGVSSVQPTTGDDAIYTLSGVRVAKPTRGLYIIRGHKVFVK